MFLVDNKISLYFIKNKLIVWLFNYARLNFLLKIYFIFIK